MEQFKHSFQEEANVGMPERLISSAAAAALLAIGMMKFAKPLSIITLVSAAVLAYRGITGFSMINKALGRNSFK